MPHPPSLSLPLSVRVRLFLRRLRSGRPSTIKWTATFLGTCILLIYLLGNVTREKATLVEGGEHLLPITPDSSDSSTDPIVPRAPVEVSFPSKDDVLLLQHKLDAYDPRAGVAFAIPVGGRTERSQQLRDIIETLLRGGAPASAIFVIEDVEGRPGRQNNAKVAAVARDLGVRVVNSHVSRADMPENGGNFGIHLARHYKFMLDFLLVSPAAAGATGADAEYRRDANGSPFEFVCIIEDDLVLAPDFVKYFYAMSRVMKVDPTLYCVSAHQDNAFFGTAYEPEPGSVTTLNPLDFDFRRGNHFMAPGWMTSREIYINVVRPRWLDENGEYAYKSQLHLRNGHWDRFFDSLIDKRDCIFPEIPRITHQGADGFTVDQKAQMELYSNLQLSALPVEVDYGNLQRLTYDGYVSTELEFIRSATLLTSLEEARLYRHTRLVYIVPARSDSDDVWNSIINGFFGVIGVGGYGGWEGYVKVRGIFHGAVFERWITNLIMLVGEYSPYIEEVRKLKPKLQLEITNGGCYHDHHGDGRDLPVLVPHYKPVTLSPLKCLSSCIHLGYRYAGLQAGMECWCGSSFGKHGSVGLMDRGSKCDKTCGDSNLPNTPVTCGGEWKNSIYWTTDDTAHVRAIAPPPDAVYIKGDVGQSCSDACAQASTPLRRLKCAESLFPLLHRHCSIMKDMIGCNSCYEEEDMTRGVYSPGGFPGGQCTLSKGRYIRCAARPDPATDYRRACVCQIKGGITNTKKP